MMFIMLQIVWHSNLSSLEQYMDKKSLPIYLGGEFNESDMVDWYTMVLDKEEIFAGMLMPNQFVEGKYIICVVISKSAKTNRV